MSQRVVLITGASSGIGAETCRLFSSKGYHCIIVARRYDKLVELATQCSQEYKNQVDPIQLDLTNEEQIKVFVSTLKRLDILINNAGVLISCNDSFIKGSTADWNTMIQTNVWGPILLTKYLLPFLIESKGHIINIGSISAKEHNKNGHIYCATKHALDSFSKCIRIDLLPYEVKVTTIHPGYVRTEIVDHMYKNEHPDKRSFLYEGYNPLVPKDVAEAIYYCISVPFHVCINELNLSSIHQASTQYIYKDY
jgi:3-hydroxy acid dehydrogenase/malonic semialdehyde reductase